MSKTVKHYKGNGTQKQFNFGMDYLQKNFINLSVAKIDKVYGSDYVVTDQDIIILVAPPMDSDVVIRRRTSTKPLVTWNDATVLTATDMTMSEVQLLHIAEEQADIAEEARGNQDIKLDRCLHLEVEEGSAVFPSPSPNKGFKWNASGVIELTEDPATVLKETGEMKKEMQSIIDSIGDYKLSKSIDGGNAFSVYLPSQKYDGGGA